MTCVHFGWIRRPVIKDIHCVLTVALLLHSIYCWNPRKRQLSCCFFLQTNQPLVSSATTSKTPLKLFFSLRRAILNTTPVKTDSPQKRLNGNENNRLSGTVCPAYSTRDKYWHKAMRLILQRRGVLLGMDLPNRKREERYKENDWERVRQEGVLKWGSGFNNVRRAALVVSCTGEWHLQLG